MQTIGSRLDASRGLGAGFDFLRVALAFGVVTWHTPQIASDSDFLQQEHFFWLGNYAILSMFFALSGFLIAGSALRLSLRDFIINRGMRIVPALAVEIMLSAFVLGSLFTSWPLSQYFSEWQTYHYFTNIVGLINYHLPGVFSNNPNNYVNVSLWTVPYEIGCYAIMAALIVFGLLKRPRMVVALALSILIIGMLMFLSGYEEASGGIVRRVFDHLFYGRGSGLFAAFSIGIAAYLLRYKIPYSWTWFGVAVALCALVASLGSHQYPHPPVSFLTSIPLAYITVFLGVSRLPTLPLFHRGDYSYGVYLYGWPVMQAMRGWFPALGAHGALLWLISVPTITLFAMFSWHAIEKPILRLRKKFSFVARQRLVEAPPKPHLAGAERDGPIIGQSTGN